jgi:DNA-binding transcriptional ArsR family regulator
MARAASTLDALGNQVRRDILELLAAGPRSVGELAARLPISRPAVSKHLRILEQAELVTSDPRGRRNLFRLDGSGFDAARIWLEAFWSDGLRRFKFLAENTR